MFKNPDFVSIFLCGHLTGGILLPLSHEKRETSRTKLLRCLNVHKKKNVGHEDRQMTQRSFRKDSGQCASISMVHGHCATGTAGMIP